MFFILYVFKGIAALSFNFVFYSALQCFFCPSVPDNVLIDFKKVISNTFTKRFHFQKHLQRYDHILLKLRR